MSRTKDLGFSKLEDERNTRTFDIVFEPIFPVPDQIDLGELEVTDQDDQQVATMNGQLSNTTEDTSTLELTLVNLENAPGREDMDATEALWQAGLREAKSLLEKYTG